MQAGQLKHRITIQYKSVTQDPEYRTEIVTWLPLVALPGSPVVGKKFYANVADVLPSRSEAVKTGLVVATNQTRFRIRYRAGIDSSMRIVLHNGGVDTLYEIVGGPAIIGRNEWLEMVGERYSS
jgi:head-tail adaptor